MMGQRDGTEGAVSDETEGGASDGSEGGDRGRDE